jgi:hypothetical protein
MNQAAKRQQELKDPQLRDDLAAACAVLKKKHSTMLLTVSKVYVRHPELAAAKANRDYTSSSKSATPSIPSTTWSKGVRHWSRSIELVIKPLIGL